MHVLIACKYEKDQIKNSGENVIVRNGSAYTVFVINDLKLRHKALERQITDSIFIRLLHSSYSIDTYS